MRVGKRRERKKMSERGEEDGEKDRSEVGEGREIASGRGLVWRWESFVCGIGYESMGYGNRGHGIWKYGTRMFGTWNCGTWDMQVRESEGV